jgi:hypothetical protein
MYGGLKKSVSLVALVAAAGIFSTGANAADLGGDCCADLEERVAELEATTARKGNRRMSLTVYGWVNKAVMAFDAPTIVNATGNAPAGARTQGVYFGLDNTNSATRFGFRGTARIAPTVTAGYSLLLDVTGGARTATVTRNNEDAADANAGADYAIRMRDSNVWLESSTIGRLTLGRLTGVSAVGVIDLAGIANIAPGAVLSGNNIAFANGVSIGQVTDLSGDYGYRQEAIRYDSPALAGFTFSASIGESTRETTPYISTGIQGRIYGVNLRYAGEFSGVRVAGGIGYERAEDETPNNGNATNIGGALSLLHVPTGLFLQGNYLVLERVNAGVTREGTSYSIQGGIGQNWFGIGKTNLYGEYAKYENDAGLFTATGFNISAAATDTTVWGLGVTQDIDAAAMQLFAGYRNFTLKEGGADQGTIGVFLAGARINF